MNGRTKPWRVGWAWVAFALLGCGCAHDLARASSGAIGCPDESITVSEVSVGWSETAWRAQCRGVSFFCSGEGAAACTPELIAEAEPTSAVENTAGPNPPKPLRTEVDHGASLSLPPRHPAAFQTDSNEHEDEHPHN